MILSLIFLLSFGICAAQEQAHLSLQVTSKTEAKMKIMLGVIKPTETLRTVAKRLQRDLEWSQQCEVVLQDFTDLTKKETIQKLSQAGYPLALFLTEQGPQEIAWRLYRTRTVAMAGGKVCHKQHSLIGCAHHIADDVWPLMTGRDGIFSTKIAYCKDSMGKGKRRYKHIYMADFDGSNEEPIVTTNTINIGPRWNNDQNNPILFFSENTKSNIRLIAIDMHKKRRIASDFDGINMLPTFSGDGKHVVYCSSRGTGACQLYHYGKGVFKNVTHNYGNNVSPSLSHDGSKLFFCSDYLHGKPQIFGYQMATEYTYPITTTGSSFCPHYSEKKGTLAYCKLVQGYSQVFIFHEKTGEHKQMTFDPTNKDECYWSPCGNYLIYGVEKGRTNRIAMLDVTSGVERFVTSEKDSCSYPTWSGRYTQYPTIRT